MRAVNELLQWSPATATFYIMPASLFCSRSISAESNTVQTEKGLGAVSMEYCEVHRTCGTALNRPSLVVLRFAGMVELPAYDCHSKEAFRSTKCLNDDPALKQETSNLRQPNAKLAKAQAEFPWLSTKP